MSRPPFEEAFSACAAPLEPEDAKLALPASGGSKAADFRLITLDQIEVIFMRHQRLVQALDQLGRATTRAADAAESEDKGGQFSAAVGDMFTEVSEFIKVIGANVEEMNAIFQVVNSREVLVTSDE